MANTAVEAMLASRRAFAVAAAGCGKTHLIGQIVADRRSGRQLVLTHTHAGVAAIKKRLVEMRVPSDKFHLDTIAGWSLRYGAAYPAISGYRPGTEADPDWTAAYPGAAKVCGTALGKRVLIESYDGVLVDEYQDCSSYQHALVGALAESLPCRAVGDPLQTVFGFRNDPVVSWADIHTAFDVVNNALTVPWRWRQEGRNASLGEWLIEARKQLETTGTLVVGEHAPVRWVQHRSSEEATEVWAAACRQIKVPMHESLTAILKWPNGGKELAKRLGGRWPIVERFDDPDLPRLAATLAHADGRTVVAALVDFVSERMTNMGTALRTSVDAITSGRGVSRITKHRNHADRLRALATAPTPVNALKWLEGVLAHRDDWWLYRRDAVYQLREALSQCSGQTFVDLPGAVAAARTRARHRGRRADARAIGTPLLVKGLEFDHAVLLWEPNHLSVQGLYVALTRASKTMTIVSATRILVPRADRNNQ